MLHALSFVMKSAIRTLIVITGIVAASSEAHAYNWMIRHDYTTCNQCHADPSGGGLLTRYGRAQAETLLKTQYGAPPEEIGRQADFLFGVIPLPDSVLAGGDVRYFGMRIQAPGAPAMSQRFLMQADLQGQVAVDRFRANASLGYAEMGDQPAFITNRSKDNLISRVHWVGVDLGEDRQFLVRAGRLNLPFGLRMLEHTAWVRATTRTDIDASQQDGVALAYNSGLLRGEVMVIVGNFQMSPAVLREHGYSGFLEFSPSVHLSLGVSSLITNTQRDVQLQTPLWRHVHGAQLRFSPVRYLVLSAEGDFLLQSQPPGTNKTGYATFAQADVEPLQGVHFIATGELQRRPDSTGPKERGMWLSAAWFLASHCDLRFDVVRQDPSAVTFLLAQIHVFL